MTIPAAPSAGQLDPMPVLKALAGLRRLAGTYPAGHPMIGQKLAELEDLVGEHLRLGPELRIDIVRGTAHLDGVSCGTPDVAGEQLLRELTDLGFDSLYVREGVGADELLALAQFLWQPRESEAPVDAQLADIGVRHVSLGRLLPIDTRWHAHQWPEAPTGRLDPSYAESLALMQQTFESTSAGKPLNAVTIADLVQLLICRVAKSHAALAQILAVKQYENLTYCHSVNVAMLSLLLGRQLGLGDGDVATLVEAALLHDIGKTRIPLDIVRKPGALTKHERTLVEAHTTYGAEILMQTDGIGPLAPIVALEHHRSVKGRGYPDLDGSVPHLLSQIVSVADIYEAMTGARSYQDPTLPERACLVLARLAGEKLNTVLVKTFVNGITFFPLGSLVRTDRGEVGVVVATNGTDPLHPVVTLLADDMLEPLGRLDTAARDGAGAYERHIIETVRPPVDLDLGAHFAEAA
jgi:putative nucleotidyltransferase with HDIG domain